MVLANELEAIIAILILLSALCQYRDGIAYLRRNTETMSTTTTNTKDKLPVVSRPKILLQGDSLTQLCWEGWGAHLANVFQRRADVVARGYGGYNTRFYLHLPIDTSLVNDDSPIVLAILWLGTNDQALPGLADHHHVPVKEYQANLQILIQRLRADYRAQRILLVGPPPVHHAQRLAYQVQRYGADQATGKLERTLETAQQYSKACQQVAENEKLPFLNLYQAMMDDNANKDKDDNDNTASDAADHGHFFSDGLHFSKQGHDFVGNAILKAIDTAFPELTVHPDPITTQWCNSASRCDALPHPGGPFHDEIDHTQPAKAFDTMATYPATTQDDDKKRKEMG